MAIAATGGNASSNSGSVTSLALASYTTTTGRVVVIAAALGSTSSSVLSIGSSAGTYSWTLQAAVNGTGVRTEIWASPVTVGAATVFTVNITGGATSIAAALEEYSGATSTFGNTGTSSGSNNTARQQIVMQFGGDFGVAALGFACQSGDTISADLGNSRQSSVPAATAVGIYLFDNSMKGNGTVVDQGLISTSRNWATAGVELEVSGGVSTPYDAYASVLAVSMETGHPNFNYLHVLEPLFAQQQTFPPTPGANNYGYTG